MVLTDKQTLYEKKFEHARENDKIIFFDYLSYKRAVGWWTGIANDDWNRPYTIKRAKYCANFLKNLPEYYFLGFPIKELLKSCYSEGYCHACAIALSLYFSNFEIVTANLVNYRDYYNQNANKKIDEFEHTFLVVDLEGKRAVIDTTWGIITDYHTYQYIFNMNKIRKISSKKLKNTTIYQYIKQRKHDVGPSYESELHKDESYQKYTLMVHEYMNMCKNYSSSNNKHLVDFINRCLYRTSNITCLDEWRMSHHFKSIIDYQIQYPTTNLFSLTDDESDLTLDSPYQNTREKNAKMLERYHSEKIVQTTRFKQKIIEFVKKSSKSPI